MPELGNAAVNMENMMATLFQNLGNDDPNVAMMLQLMQSQQPVVDEGEASGSRELEIRLSETEHELEIVRAEARRLLAAHRASVERLSDLSAALGACGLCWGDDPNCPGCRGRGHIGMMRPDNEIRARLLGPSRRASPHAGHPESRNQQTRSETNVQ